jgi:uncharacterized iron-regulated membrane protein
VHYWLSGIFAVPLLIISITGVALQLKKQITWVQPTEQKVKIEIPTASLDAVFFAAKADSRMGVRSWSDIQRIDVRPGKGIAKVISNSGWEGQVSLKDGKLLQVAERRSDWIESIHDGSFFGGDISKLGVFLMSGIVLILLIISGIWMFILPFRKKKKTKKA